MNIIEGKLIGKGYKVAIIASRFNSIIVDRLIEGAVDSFTRHGIESNDIMLYKVPGAFEIPMAISKLLRKSKFDGILSLGAIIRGETPHFDYIANEVSKGVAQLALASDIPISFGVLTTDTTEQAIQRAGSKMGNKGFSAAAALIEMINLYKQF
ncbi:MAG: 6,7-dimethyl-8-ribityllumazine synthase [Epsilonproteobacteria bacterium]|nr:6,7-dimethyl-8-ribityllumazine synthase [Campylobacterota bacterium]